MEAASRRPHILALLHSFKHSNFDSFLTQLNVILTHVDKDPNASGFIMWAQSYMVNDLCNEFKSVVDISSEIHVINAQSKKMCNMCLILCSRIVIQGPTCVCQKCKDASSSCQRNQGARISSIDKLECLSQPLPKNHTEDLLWKE